MTTKAKAKPTKEPTSYVILERVTVHLDGVTVDKGDERVEVWVVVGVKPATNANIAIKLFATEREGTFKAVPERSWRGGLTIKPVQKTESLPFED